MNLKNLASSLAVLSLSLTSACVYTEPVPGNVTFLWRFDGRGCYGDGGVETVHIEIPGESLENRGYYPCSANGNDGVTLYDFYPGTYDFYLEAIDYSGYVSFEASGRFTVDGDTTVRVDLYPAR
ncbi:hypothetical protein [Cystobacter ferrugineus]|uniref:Ig-like domain-containing protein n=1 Tax=Cystobacter ferrugineus TaxID=83449 RepID=A0A1L9B2D9_9BACT|nr:hypothetical protein [Cystobacter ferrugineus]OJH36414.1 hypothetical protein BON30_32075 [Cystobacter ferrugineus]